MRKQFQIGISQYDERTKKACEKHDFGSKKDPHG